MRVFIAFLMFSLGAVIAKAQPTVDIIDYINTYKQLAMEEMQRTGVPASITLAQGIHETYAGKSELVLKSNNHFGIKCKSYWTGKKVYHDDDARGECFRKYDEPSQSYRDHSDFLKAGAHYAPLFNLDVEDYKGWAHGLKKAGYATNPKYAPIIIKLIEEYNLQQYTLIAMGKMAPEDEIIAVAPKPATDIPADISAFVKQQDPMNEIPPPPVTNYPAGEFTVNNTKVIFAKQGTTLLSIARNLIFLLGSFLISMIWKKKRYCRKISSFIFRENAARVMQMCILLQMVNHFTTSASQKQSASPTFLNITIFTNPFSPM